MTKAQAAHAYLNASMKAGYNGLPAEHREAQEATMADLERQHSGVREHAIVGENRDFDSALSPGEREHQQHMRAGASSSELAERRKAIRGGAKTTKPRAAARATRAGFTGARAYRRGAKSLAPAGASDAGSIGLQALTVGVSLALAYLLLHEGKGPSVFKALLGAVTSAVRFLIAPIDPLNPAGTAATKTESEDERIASTTAGLSGAINGAPLAGGLGVDTPASKSAAKKLLFGPPPNYQSLVTP